MQVKIGGHSPAAAAFTIVQDRQVIRHHAGNGHAQDQGRDEAQQSQLAVRDGLQGSYITNDHPTVDRHMEMPVHAFAIGQGMLHRAEKLVTVVLLNPQRLMDQRVKAFPVDFLVRKLLPPAAQEDLGVAVELELDLILFEGLARKYIWEGEAHEPDRQH